MIMSAKRILPVLLGAWLWSVGSAQAQTTTNSQAHVVDRGAIDRAVAAKVTAEGQQREGVLRELRRPETQTVAKRLGLKVADLETAVAGLDEKDLAQLASSVRNVDEAYAGGDVVVISVTTLLLVLILLVLILK
jgi:hypothetical protein